MRMAKSMRLNELVGNYRSIYGGFESWDQLLTDVSANFYESWALDALVEDLQSHGSFRNPVVIGRGQRWADADEDPEAPDSTFPAVLDGTKRVLAHMVLGLESVQVDDRTESGFVVGGDLDRYTMSTKVEIPLPLISVRGSALTIPEQPVDEDAEMDLWDGIMSLRVNDEHWLSALTSGSQREDGALRYSLAWDVDALRVPVPLINNAMLAQIRSFGFDVSRIKVHTIIEDWQKDAPVEVEQGALRHLLSGFGDPAA